jgi:predicted flap endonuclease-1-like 5' DNA nuclease
MIQFFLANPLFYLFTLVLGGIIGWFLRIFLHEKALRDEFMLRDQERIHLAATNTQLKSANDLKDADLRRVSLELQQLQDQANHFDRERQLHLSAVQSAAQKMQSTQIELQSLTVKSTSYDEQILGLRTRNAQLTGEMNIMRDTIKKLENGQSSKEQNLQNNTQGLEEAIAQLEQERNQTQHELDAAYLEIENLQAELLEKNKPMTMSKGLAIPSKATNGILENVKASDDLKIINGIGPFTEKKLKELGIYTFAQLAGMNVESTEKLNESLGLYNGKIKKEGWIEQAKHLAEVDLEVA